ncbi:MAG: DNA repair protein RadA [Deltaproteobacteria bacterium]|nr:DNA repair protein RadA [Deltaproteobacteria bacterium]
MSKSKTVYTCQNCGAQSPKWMGKCPDCNQWNSYVEETYAAPSSGNAARAPLIDLNPTQPQPITEISAELGEHISINMPELDRVLGGGYVPGSAILIGGDPGIGKSTLILQTLKNLAQLNKKVLYASGEESAAQIKTRAERLDVHEKSLLVVTENCLERILEMIRKHKPDVIAIDSVQTIYSQNLASAPGTVSQVRECAGQIITTAKSTGMACLLVGHVTKDGSLAGPKVLEHMVDCVLYFESDQGHTFRILRSIKNRFGAANEIGVFEMTGEGLKEVSNPSQLFLSERSQNTAGSVVVSSLEGTRPLLLEIQALVTHSGLGTPRRTAIGVDNGRVALLVAVLEKVVGISLSDQDIFVNVAGGLKVTEPALDLGISMAIYSSFRNLPIDHKTVFIGEVGLTGEVRAVNLLDLRLKEAAKLGFAHCFTPQNKSQTKNNIEGLELHPVKTIEECLHQLF